MVIPSLNRARRPGFTLIEVMVVVSIVTTLSVLVFLNYAQINLQSRNSGRKSNASTLTAAIKSRQSIEGNAFLTYNGGDCTVSGQSALDHGAGHGAGCAGASGLGFGLVDVNNALTTGETGHQGHSYSGHSLDDALNGTYLKSVIHDPSNTDPNDLMQRHPAVLRCCSDGTQNISKSGQSFAVWVQLEPVNGSIPLNASEITTTSQGCGGSAALPSAYPGYKMDFGGIDGEAPYNFAIPGGTLPNSVNAQVLPSQNSCSAA